MKLDDLKENIEKAHDELGGKIFSGIALEDADPSLLVPTIEDLSEHVAMQPTAIAYYGAAKAQSIRMHDEKKRDYDIWLKRKYSEAKKSLKSKMSVAAKITIDDIKSELYEDNEDELKKWNDEIDQLREMADTFEIHYNAWIQKGYALKEFARIAFNEFVSTDSISEKDVSVQPKKARIKPTDRFKKKEEKPITDNKKDDVIEGKSRKDRLREAMNKNK